MKICRDFQQNPSVNPITGRKITPDSPIYQNLVSRCGVPSTKHCYVSHIGRSNEDRFSLISEGNLRIYGIFDGHGGSGTSDYLQEHLLSKLSQRLKGADFDDWKTIQSIINQTYLDLDREVPGKESGSTAAVALVVPGKVYLVNLGDSRQVIFDRKGKIIFESADNKPSDPEERARIISKGGRVINAYGGSRVDGVLAVSRAFGDYSLKKANQKELYDPFGWVTVIPNIYLVPVPIGAYLMIASDGVWDGFSSQDAVNYLLENGSCESLVNEASKRTTDDVSLLVAEL